MEKHLTWNIPVFDSDNSISRAARAAQKVVLEEIYLVEAKTWRKPGIPPEVLTLKNKVSAEIIYLKEYKNRLAIYSPLCKFGVIAFAQKSPNKPIIKIEASFCTSFSYDLDDSDFKDFRTLDPEEGDYGLEQYLYRIMPISTAWPYWRELVQNMSTRMGFPTLMAPLLKIVPKKIEIDYDAFE
jgi:hypothetical protein